MTRVRRCIIQCDQIVVTFWFGDCLKFFLVTTSLTKVTQILGDFLGYFDNITLLVKTALASFGATFGATFENFGYFLLQLWSHWIMDIELVDLVVTIHSQSYKIGSSNTLILNKFVLNQQEYISIRS